MKQWKVVSNSVLGRLESQHDAVSSMQAARAHLAACLPGYIPLKPQYCKPGLWDMEAYDLGAQVGAKLFIYEGERYDA